MPESSCQRARLGTFTSRRTLRYLVYTIVVATRTRGNPDERSLRRESANASTRTHLSHDFVSVDMLAEILARLAVVEQACAGFAHSVGSN